MTAETAMVLPVLGLVGVLLACLGLLGVAQLRVTDAAREAARLAARDESPGHVAQAVRRAAPDGATVRVVESADDVTATVSVSLRVPGPLGGALPSLHLDAAATAAQEGP